MICEYNVYKIFLKAFKTRINSTAFCRALFTEINYQQTKNPFISENVISEIIVMNSGGRLKVECPINAFKSVVRCF